MSSAATAAAAAAAVVVHSSDGRRVTIKEEDPDDVPSSAASPATPLVYASSSSSSLPSSTAPRTNSIQHLNNNSFCDLEEDGEIILPSEIIRSGGRDTCGGVDRLRRSKVVVVAKKKIERTMRKDNTAIITQARKDNRKGHAVTRRTDHHPRTDDADHQAPAFTRNSKKSSAGAAAPRSSPPQAPKTNYCYSTTTTRPDACTRRRHPKAAAAAAAAPAAPTTTTTAPLQCAIPRKQQRIVQRSSSILSPAAGVIAAAKPFANKSVLVAEEEIIISPRKTTCTGNRRVIPGQSLVNPSAEKKKKSESGSSSSNFPCHRCGRRNFPSVARLLRHQETCSNGVYGAVSHWKCDSCGKTKFSRVQAFASHLVSCRRRREEPDLSSKVLSLRHSSLVTERECLSDYNQQVSETIQLEALSSHGANLLSHRNGQREINEGDIAVRCGYCAAKKAQTSGSINVPNSLKHISHCIYLVMERHVLSTCPFVDEATRTDLREKKKLTTSQSMTKGRLGLPTYLKLLFPRLGLEEMIVNGKKLGVKSSL